LWTKRFCKKIARDYAEIFGTTQNFEKILEKISNKKNLENKSKKAKKKQIAK
jgi:hypothetical protein